VPFEKLQRQDKRRPQEEDDTSGQEPLFKEEKSKRSKRDGGNLQDMAGIDERYVLRCQCKEKSAEKRGKPTDTDRPAIQVGSNGSLEKMEHHEPGNAGRLRDQVENDLVLDEEMPCRPPPLGRVAAVAVDVPYRIEMGFQGIQQAVTGRVLDGPVELVQDVGSPDDLVRKQDLAEKYDKHSKQKRQYKKVFFTVGHGTLRRDVHRGLRPDKFPVSPWQRPPRKTGGRGQALWSAWIHAADHR